VSKREAKPRVKKLNVDSLESRHLLSGFSQALFQSSTLRVSVQIVERAITPSNEPASTTFATSPTITLSASQLNNDDDSEEDKSSPDNPISSQSTSGSERPVVGRLDRAVRDDKDDATSPTPSSISSISSSQSMPGRPLSPELTTLTQSRTEAGKTSSAGTTNLSQPADHHLTLASGTTSYATQGTLTEATASSAKIEPLAKGESLEHPLLESPVGKTCDVRPDLLETVEEVAVPASSGLLSDFLPIEGTSIEAALDRFFEHFEELSEVPSWIADPITSIPEPVIWAVTGVAIEIGRRMVKRRDDRRIDACLRVTPGPLSGSGLAGWPGSWSSRIS
jgi:hypothetical protein